jgi:hypothetical protein
LQVNEILETLLGGYFSMTAYDFFGDDIDYCIEERDLVEQGISARARCNAARRRNLAKGHAIKAERTAKGDLSVLPVLPIGFKYAEGIVVENDQEQEVLALIEFFYFRGDSSGEITKKLTLLGYTNRAGKPYPYSTIYKIVKRLEGQQEKAS